jgi:hypothetical protein
VRIASLLEQNGRREVVIAFPRSSKVAVLKERSPADLAALKAQAQVKRQ